MANLKIAMIEYLGGHGGNEFYDFGLCESITKAGIPVTLYTSAETSLDQHVVYSTDIKKVYKDIFTGKNRLIKGLRLMRGTLQALHDCKKQKIDIAHFHIYHFSILEFIQLWLFRKMRMKIVATIHDIESFAEYGKKIKKERYTKFETTIDKVIVHSEYAKKSLKKYFVHFDEDSIEKVLPLDMDFVFDKNISRSTARELLDLNPTAPILLFFGHIKEVKGLDILIEGLSLIKNEIKNIKLLIAGKSWKVNFEIYEKMIKKHRLESNIIIRNEFIPNHQVPYYFKSADLVILPYKKIFNSSVLQRALAYSSAIVVSNLEPFMEIIKDGYNGVIFEGGNARDLSMKIKMMISDESKRHYLQKNAYATSKTMYSEKAIGLQMKNLYLSI
jgi:D-inositol-3-phosphate glycosyltransferase